ncbi:multifunctional methyltransferase subunit TRM112-like protein [Sitophilus oryzae]|uniref:Multifunctional methyltransferase subunit TRM112-like protein n=1 Tax=Sitophilus oryzae TaxID=7048 RepID=A0A6J2YSU7_SITOR|nr:multifunctional methyltransferase subunit TRM112-like protein [Sitophilus oryzae]
MKLLTHNMLTSKCIRGVNVGYPLSINASDVRVADVDFNPDFISRMIPKIDWPVLYNAVERLGHVEDLPKETPVNYESNEDFLKKAHHALLEVEIIHGELVCPESGRKFPINNGIPNMLLNEDEI